MSKIFKKLSLDFSSKEGREKVFGAVQYFANAHRKESEKIRQQVQAFGAPGDFPTSILPLIEKFHAQPSYDTGFEEVFDIRDYTASRRNGFDILDVEDGLTFSEVPLGDKVKVYKMAGTKTSVTFNMYGGGLGWHRTLIDDEEYWTLEDNARSFINKWYEYRASCFYALIEALGAGYNVTWQNPDPSTLSNTNETYTANRDAQTLNAAALQIFDAVKDKGYGVNAITTQLVILSPLQLIGRLNKALNLLLQGFSGSPNQVSYKFRLIPTTMLATTTVYYVALPKIKAKGGDRMRLTIYNKFDEESYSDIAVGWGRFGGAIGDSDQFARCATS